MRSRYFAGAAAAWAVAYAFGYLAVIHDQDDSEVAWWYVALIAIGVVALGGVAAGAWGRVGLLLGLVVLVSCCVLGLLTIGLLLVPAVVAAIVALISYPEGALTPSEPRVNRGG